MSACLSLSMSLEKSVAKHQLVGPRKLEGHVMKGWISHLCESRSILDTNGYSFRIDFYGTPYHQQLQIQALRSDGQNFSSAYASLIERVNAANAKFFVVRTSDGKGWTLARLYASGGSRNDGTE